MRQLLIFTLLGMLALGACKKSNRPDNPFDDPKNKPPVNTGPTDPLSLANFAGLHRQIFKPTCSNSGCHDGTFEPDFRTIESSYNTMVYQPVIKNNAAGSFLYRVLPGNANGSVLHERVVVDIDGISGIMPLLVDPQSDWPAKKAEYIAAIVAWINGGARDMFGNPPVNGPANPRLQGLMTLGTGYALSFEQGEVSEYVLLTDKVSRKVIRRPIQPLSQPVQGSNVFDEPSSFTHFLSSEGLQAGKYQLVVPGREAPVFESLQDELCIEVR
ncbi:MAG: hypothetical protein Q8J69_09925 [Sphingobacteriaceae bacterium]|nr:hypothetical protein [Sphingobacteriaceae bacterium]